METIQEKNQNGLKREKKSLVTIVVYGSGKVNQKLRKQNDTFVQQIAMQDFAKKDCQKRNITTGKEVSALTKHIGVGSRNILNTWHISKQEDMQDSEMQKVHTLLRNGKSSVENITGDVFNVKRGRNSLKTILNLFQRVEVIISQTFNHFAEIVIVGSGSFNIYETPELLKNL